MAHKVVQDLMFKLLLSKILLQLYITIALLILEWADL